MEERKIGTLEGDPLTLLVQWLEVIAKKNKDTFDYKVGIKVVRNGLVFRFACIETADRHEFVTGFGPTMDDAVSSALNSVKDSCEAWSYDFVDMPAVVKGKKP